MADPFSIVAGVAGLSDVCFRLVSYVRSLKQDVNATSSQLAALTDEIETLRKLCQAVQGAIPTSTAVSLRSHSTPTTGDRRTANEKQLFLWSFVDGCVKECHSLVEQLHALLVQLCSGDTGSPTSPSGTLAKLKTALAKRSVDDDLNRIRRDLGIQHGTLNTLLTLISVQDGRLAHITNLESIANVANDVHFLRRRVESQRLLGGTASPQTPTSPGSRDALAALEHLDIWFNSMPAETPLRVANQYFDIPQAVSSYYVGREDLLHELRDAFIQPPGPLHKQRQRRFVVHGIGGSGKTQFCCKFAEENRDSFWGVFYIDGSSKAQLEQTFGRIGRLAGLDKSTANELSMNAALHWLSTEQRRWLLIIDNADDPSISLETYFPKGNRGHILITTRVPGHSIHNQNVELQPYNFSSRLLSPEEATNLLLRAARRPSPWDVAWRKIAHAITETLGYLSLAICLAGAAIRTNLCDLNNFDEFYDLSWQQVQYSSYAPDDPDHKFEVCAVRTWEMLYLKLETENTQRSRDATQLLNVFAFLHRENIPRELLERALANADLETAQAEKDNQQAELESQRQTTSYLDWLSSKQRSLLMFLFRARGPTPFPDAIRWGRMHGNSRKGVLRVKQALSELTQRSLIDYNEISKSYTMHPIVHKWARMRQRLSRQSLWADTAGMVLSASILLPPLGLEADDDTYHLSLLPHVKHVQACREAISEEMEAKRALTWKARLYFGETLYAERLVMFGKFSLVYMRSGGFNEAERLLTLVVDTLVRILGQHNSRTRRVSLALSDAYWMNSKPEEAAILQVRQLSLCQKHLGPGHPDTLRVMSKLGHTRWQQGKLSDALELQRQAVQGLKRTLGDKHQDTLTAMDQLGRTVIKFYRRADIEEAHQLHRTAMEGLKALHGPDHAGALDAQESLSRTALLLGVDYAVQAEQLMAEVLQRRQSRYGKTNPMTLLAMVNMAIAKCAIQQPRKAEALMREGLLVAESMYGVSHIATAWGRCILGLTLIQQQRYDEAEAILQEVSETQKSMAARRGDFHPDRLGTLAEMARCYYLHGKMAESIETCDEAIRGLQSISKPGVEHALSAQLKMARASMVLRLEHRSSGLSQAPALAPPVFPAINFCQGD
ncbi:uncharacterized protein F5Z01DRAFT_278372 [Emericellopsis atlantica]|uniref:NB-ARC domain-containing protein n=1 Tax=Emericellopsis atlantica TaxID=2614577 RepID=A0A9P7ZGS2_9HYPO|nr:uncharacterized protein F5Z01DRAFT_278372 [Emericellopsis atlantica]KAG9251387.1 hypothetical protein F5Z01DRAFT_278372 [Emericellopsis atlantica]